MFRPQEFQGLDAFTCLYITNKETMRQQEYTSLEGAMVNGPIKLFLVF